MSVHAERDTVTANLSVRLSVRLSHAGIVSKRMHMSSKSFHRLDLVGAVFEAYRYKIQRGTPSAGALNTRE